MGSTRGALQFNPGYSSLNEVGRQSIFTGAEGLVSPVLEPFPLQQAEVAPDELPSQSRKRKRSDSELEEKAIESEESGSYAKILQELSFIRQQNNEISESIAGLQAQMTQLIGVVERMRPGLHLDAGFFGRRQSSLPPLPAAEVDSELDQEVATLTGRSRVPTPFQFRYF